MTQQEMWTTVKILTWTKDYLTSKGVDNARLEAEWMLCAATGLDRVGLYLNFEKPLSEEELAGYRTMVARRAKREPLQHILGSQEFCGLDFMVSPDVLIPRHDTELLVAEALVRSAGAHSVLDIGTGSGCVAVALAKQLPAATVTATDISEAALIMAQINATQNGATVEFLSGSLFTAVADRRFDLIVSNPPYIPTLDIAALESEVRDFDPRAALDGGLDGLDVYRALIPDASAHLNPGGWLLVETGVGQAANIVQLFNATGRYGEPFTSLDIHGIERVVGAQRKESV